MENYNVYNSYYQLTFRFALKRVKEYSIAEDIASQVIYLFLLKKDKIKQENINGWLIKTANNFVKKYFNSIVKEENLKNDSTKKMNTDYKLAQSDTINYIQKSYINSLKKLTVSEKELLDVYLKNELNVHKTASYLNKPYSEIQKKIYEIKTKIKAYGYREFGYIVTKNIIPPNLNRSIMNFLNKFKLAIENDNLHKLNRYFSSEQLKQISTNIHIKKIADYEVSLENNEYNLSVVYYNYENKIEAFSFNFKLKNNRIKITKIPQKKEEVYVFDQDSLAGKKILNLIKNSPRDKTGRLLIPSELIEQIIKESQTDDKKD